LIAGTKVGRNLNRIVGPIYTVDLATGDDTQPPLPLEQTEETRDTTTISDARLSSDAKLLLVKRTVWGLFSIITSLLSSTCQRVPLS